MSIKAYFKRFFGHSTKSQSVIKLIDLPIHFREAIALHNIFMVFGIPQTDIFVGYQNKSFQVIAYQDRDDIVFDAENTKKDRREFCVIVADLDLDDATFERTWRDATKTYNIATSDERLAMTESTEAHKGMLKIVVYMLAKGFKSPVLQPELDKIEQEKECN